MDPYLQAPHPAACGSRGMAVSPGPCPTTPWLYMPPFDVVDAQNRQYPPAGSGTCSAAAMAPFMYTTAMVTGPACQGRMLPQSFTAAAAAAAAAGREACALPLLQFPGKLVYAFMPEECDDGLERVPWDSGVVGMDIEWRPNFKEGVAPNKTALIQLCWRNKDGKHWKPGSKVNLTPCLGYVGFSDMRH